MGQVSLDVVAEFGRMERMYVGLDGAFVWVVQRGDQRYQVDGVLIDDGECLLSVEVKMTRDPALFESLVKALGWPRQPLLYQLVQHGVFLEEDEFVQHFLDC